MATKAQIVSALSEFFRLQSLLTSRLSRLVEGRHGGVDHLLLNVPRTGVLELEGRAWRWRRHGTGVEFRDPSGITVDVERDFAAGTNLITAWRASFYFESVGLQRCQTGKADFDCTEQDDVGRLFQELEADGLLTKEKGAFRLASLGGGSSEGTHGGGS